MSRYILRLMVGVLLWWSGASFALVPVQTSTQYKISNQSTWYSTRIASCTAWMTTQDAADTEWTYDSPYIVSGGASDGYCSYKRKTIYQPTVYQSDSNPIVISTQAVTGCPANSTSVTGGCQCA
ncbi:hypothetical protein ACCC97_28765, partial [Variovorax sp. Varisp85]|uniref:hypothetical protein n=1 Tax=Variovorax sp. Varisp85 TaxID=3243059 RepID=UPI0039A553B1